MDRGLAMAIDVTPARVRATADLCRLDLRDDEVAPLAAQLQKILDAIAELDALDVSAVAPMSHAQSPSCALHDDVVSPGLARDEVMAQAPRTELGAFVVPRFVDE
jgi:aspartyl-tRNA(Asn)/glutamyl-tRNA(Gln) amidotransferase subunit C